MDDNVLKRNRLSVKSGRCVLSVGDPSLQPPGVEGIVVCVLRLEVEETIFILCDGVFTISLW